MLRYDGTKWSPETSGTTVTLNAIWGAGKGELWASGDDGVVLRFDGKKWTKMVTGSTHDLLGIWGVAASNLYAVGGSYYSSPLNTSIILHRCNP